MSDTERIDRLEGVVRALNQQLVELRAEVVALGGRARPAAASAAAAASIPTAAPAPKAATAAAPKSAPSAQPTSRAVYENLSKLNFEELIGRYGTIALATLALLAGMGAFLTWAIAHGLLGPAQRVILGGLGAAGVAAIGWWLRSRGTLRFGNTLLAISLALVHLDLWAAGPRLHVIPSSVALAVTAVASVALAMLALRTEEETLFCVGFGGALLAPFVTSTGGGSAVVLATFGFLVIAASIAALESRSWRIATVLAGVGCFVYSSAAHGLLNASSPWAERTIPIVLALACAGAALAWGAPDSRARLALGFLVVGAAALIGSRLTGPVAPAAAALGVIGTVAALAAPRRGPTPGPWKLAANVFLPLGFLIAAVTRLADATSTTGALMATIWVAIAGAAAMRDESERDIHLVTAYLASAFAIVLASSSHLWFCAVALAAHAALASLVMARRNSAELVAPIAFVLAATALLAFVLLFDRTAYEYRPFLTLPSVAALACTLAIAVFARSCGRVTKLDLAIVAPLPALAAFMWIRTELAHAFSRDMSVFLLILYYALAGIAAIFYGRRRSYPQARAVGLALACYAALKALVHAWTLSAIALRVGACLLAGAFVALVAYWYREE